MTDDDTSEIPQQARGTAAFTSGLAIVGEPGPELVMLPKGAHMLNIREFRASVESGTKASARHSKADMAHVQAAHDAYQALTDGAVCGDVAQKAGARHSAADMADFQAGHDATVRHGATCASADAAKALSLDQQTEAARGAIYQALNAAREQAYRAGQGDDTIPYCDPIQVYADYVIVRSGLAFYKVPYTLSDTGAEVPPLAEWQRVEQEWQPSYAVKALPLDGRVGGYAVLFGSKERTDLEGDFFTPETDFWLETTGPRRPMIYDHATDAATKSRPTVGVWDTAVVDDIGIWLEGQRDMRHRYAGAIKQLIDEGKLALSSDSALHLVQRRKAGKGANEVQRWPLFGASLTTHPMEPRMLPVAAIKAAYKEIGLDITISGDDGSQATPTGATAQRDEARARRLALSFDLLETENTLLRRK